MQTISVLFVVAYLGDAEVSVAILNKKIVTSCGDIWKVLLITNAR